MKNTVPWARVGDAGDLWLNVGYQEVLFLLWLKLELITSLTLII